MATVVLTNAKVTVNSVDLSAYVRSITLNYQAEAQDDTNMGDTTKVSIGGLKSWGGSVEFTQDYAASAPDVTIFSLIGSTATFEATPVNTTVSSTNPKYNGTALFTGFEPVKGSVGQVATTTLSFTSAGTLSRSTS